DRMLDMGFMDEIKALLKQIPADRQTLLFSATCDDNLFALSKVLLRDPELIEVAPRNTTAAEVEQRVYAVDGDRKLALVEHMLTVKGWAPALIFSRTRQGADKLAQQ
ncbi:DEAD/DEAH box helicase, partial [Aeromonas media]